MASVLERRTRMDPPRQRPAARRAAAPRARQVPIRTLAIVTVVGLASTWVATTLVAGEQERAHLATLDRLAREIRTAVELRATAASEALFGLRAQVMASGGADRERFHRTVELSGVLDRVPGIAGISFDRRIAPGDVAAYERSVRADRSMRAEGYPGFEVYPPSAGDALVVEFVEPLAPNLGAMGFDIASEPRRRAALEEARDSGEVIGSAPIELVQSDGEDLGFLMMAAVYDRAELPVTAPARRRAFEGVLVAVFRIDDLIPATVNALALDHVAIEDVGGIVERSAGATTAVPIYGRNDAGEPSRSTDVNVADRRWRVTVADPEGTFAPSRIGLLATTGSGIALTGVGLLMILIHVRGRQVTTLEASESRLLEVDRMKTAFLGTVSHELRTPLTAISGFATLLERGATSGMSQQEMLSMIARNAASLDALIDELLQFTRLERDEVRIQLEELDVAEHVYRVVGQLAPLLRGHELEQRIDPSVLAIADAEALRRIVTNLLTNAAKFSPEGSRIRISVRRGFGEAIIEVDDQGPGIPLEDRDRIFERFYRSPGTELDAPGTGIGLAVVQQLVRLQHGTIEVGDAEDGGARFVVRLPFDARNGTDPLS